MKDIRSCSVMPPLATTNEGIENTIKSGKIVPLYEGSSINYRIELEGKAYVLKRVNPEKYNPGVLEKTQKILFGKTVPLNYRVIGKERTAQKTISLETEILKNWEEAKIPAPRVLATDNKNMIIMDYIEGRDYLTLLREGKFQQKHLDGMIEVIGSIREAAKSRNNKKFLHNDAHLGNFMSNEEGNTVTIDPGLQVNYEKMTFEQLDASINLFFLHYLGNGYKFKGEEYKEEREAITKIFIKSLDIPILQTMRDLDKPLSPSLVLYNETTKLWTKKVSWFETYNEYEVRKLKKMFDDRIKR